MDAYQGSSGATPSLLSFQGVPVVTLHVGSDKIVFLVHEKLLCEASKVFKAAFSTDNKFRESSDKSMSLPEDDVDAVERLLQWLYFKKIKLTAAKTSETTRECYWQLAKLNTLADKFDIVGIKNDIIDTLYELKAGPMEPPQLPVITYIYANTTRQSPLRKLMVAWFVWHIHMDWYKLPSTTATLADVPEFTADVAIALASRVGTPMQDSPFKVPPSAHYEKRDNEA